MAPGRSDRPPNRPLDLDELERPHFRAVDARLDALRARLPELHLHSSKRWELPWALERARLRPASRLLDVGCGASVFPSFLAEQGHAVIAVDCHLPRTLARLAHRRLAYVEGDLARLPLPDASFDAAFCISVIEHLPPTRARDGLQELRRVLRPGARLLLTTDLAEDVDEEIWFDGPEEPPFRVDWALFDAARVRDVLLSAPGWHVEGDVDLHVDWPRERPRLRAFHGLPYTAFGVTLRRA